MTTSRADLPVVINRAAGIPLAVQVAGQLRDLVTSGLLAAGDRLPSSRDLASVLGVSRTVITGAYTRLFAEGWLEGRHGSGTFVADVASPLLSSSTTASPLAPAQPPSPGEAIRAQALIELRAGVPWAGGIDPAAWRRAWRAAGRHPAGEWPELFGIWELREELASFLRRSRGLAVTPDQILITRGVTSGLGMLTTALVRPGDRVGVEEPGYPKAREVLARAGATVVSCRVDAAGIVPSELPDGLRLLYTTPAHQYPLGGRLPVGRRQALAEWARSCGAMIVEDDYDSEFRYDVGPLPALFGMGGGGRDQDVIAYLGTASKVLTPSVGVGWLVGSVSLVARLAADRDRLGERVSEPAQHAMAALLASGDLERHIRRMRLEYSRRRAALVAGLGQDGFRLLGDTAGMHVVLELPSGTLASDVASAALRRGVSVATLDRYFVGPVTVEALILGYGATSLPQVRKAAAVLRELLATPGNSKTLRDYSSRTDEPRRARARRLPSCMACTRATGIVWPSAMRSSGSACGDGRVAAQGSAPASSRAAFRTVKSPGDTSSSQSQATGNETGTPGRARGL
jgi:GntR family transcriptional regulator / MocR family aminotransferase